jgi:hypothetical protein
MPSVAETFKTVIDKITHVTKLKLVNISHAANAKPTDEDLITRLDKPDNRCIIHLVLYDTLTSRAKPSSYSQPFYCAWSVGIFDESHRYKTKCTVGWQIAINVKIECKLQVTPTPEFHLLYDWCYQTMCLFSGVPDDPEDDTEMEKHGAEAFYSAVKSVMHAIRTEATQAQDEMAH